VTRGENRAKPGIPPYRPGLFYSQTPHTIFAKVKTRLHRQEDIVEGSATVQDERSSAPNRIRGGRELGEMAFVLLVSWEVPHFFKISGIGSGLILPAPRMVIPLQESG
jgi:hypothetical protein